MKTPAWLIKRMIRDIRWHLALQPRCAVCHRPLTTKRDIKRGVGAGCFKKQAKLQKTLQ